MCQELGEEGFDSQMVTGFVTEKLYLRISHIISNIFNFLFLEMMSIINKHYL